MSGGSLRKSLTLAIYAELRKTMSMGDQVREKLMRVARVFPAFQIKIDPTGNYAFGFEVSPAEGIADSGEFERDVLDLLEELGRAARELGMGILLAIDELQDAPKDDLNGLNVALHTLGQAAWPMPVMFLGTGLPSLPSVLADATSYAERLYDFRTLERLNDSETTIALTRPAEARGVISRDGIGRRPHSGK